MPRLAVKAGGSGDVTRMHRVWTSMKGSNVSSPVCHDGHLYWMNDNRGTAYCAQADTGEVVYEERLNCGSTGRKCLCIAKRSGITSV